MRKVVAKLSLFVDSDNWQFNSAWLWVFVGGGSKIMVGCV